MTTASSQHALQWLQPLASSQHGAGVAGGGGLGVAAGSPLQSRVSVLRQTPGVQERVQVMMVMRRG